MSKEFEIILFITLFIPFISPNTPVINEYELESAKCLGKIADIEAINSLICDKNYDNEDKIFSNPYKVYNNVNYQNNIVNLNKIKDKRPRIAGSLDKNFISINKEASFNKSFSSKTTSRKNNCNYDVKLSKNEKQNTNINNSKHVNNFTNTIDNEKAAGLLVNIKNEEECEVKKQNQKPLTSTNQKRCKTPLFPSINKRK